MKYKYNIFLKDHLKFIQHSGRAFKDVMFINIPFRNVSFSIGNYSCLWPQYSHISPWKLCCYISFVLLPFQKGMTDSKSAAPPLTTVSIVIICFLTFISKVWQCIKRWYYYYWHLLKFRINLHLNPEFSIHSFFVASESIDFKVRQVWWFS